MDKIVSLQNLFKIVSFPNLFKIVSFPNLLEIVSFPNLLDNALNLNQYAFNLDQFVFNNVHSTFHQHVHANHARLRLTIIILDNKDIITSPKQTLDAENLNTLQI